MPPAAAKHSSPRLGVECSVWRARRLICSHLVQMLSLPLADEREIDITFLRPPVRLHRGHRFLDAGTPQCRGLRTHTQRQIGWG